MIDSLFVQVQSHSPGSTNLLAGTPSGLSTRGAETHNITSVHLETTLMPEKITPNTMQARNQEMRTFSSRIDLELEVITQSDA